MRIKNLNNLLSKRHYSGEGGKQRIKSIIPCFLSIQHSAFIILFQNLPRVKSEDFSAGKFITKIKAYNEESNIDKKIIL